MSKTKDRPVNMPCSDPEGCKHFKAEMALEEENKRLREQVVALNKKVATQKAYIEELEEEPPLALPL